MWEDPIVAEVHRIREELCARFNYDVDAILADIHARQAALGARLVSRIMQAEPAKAVDLPPSAVIADSAGSRGVGEIP